MASRSGNIKKIKSDLKKNCFSSALIFLNTNQPPHEIINFFKEQRLLLIPTEFKHLEKAYLTFCEENCSHDRFRQEKNYVQYINTYRIATEQVTLAIKNHLEPFNYLSLKNFFFLTNIYLDKYFQSLNKEVYAMIENQLERAGSIEEKASITESLFHFNKGRINDAIFSQLNLGNIFSEVQNDGEAPGKPLMNLDKAVEEELNEAFILSAHLNSYKYAMDKISYGEWEVRKAVWNSPQKIFEFSIIDIPLQKAREIGLQRMLSGKITGRNNRRWIKDFLEEIFLDIYEAAWNYYQEKDQLLIIQNIYYKKFKEWLLKALDALDVEDELLIALAVNHPSILSHYLIAGTFLSFGCASQAIKESVPTREYEFTFPFFSIDKIKNILSRLNVPGDSIDIELFEFYYKELPLKNSLDLVNCPFIRQENEIMGLNYLMIENWTSWVRGNLMKGGTVANTIGKAWESYIAGVFENNKWATIQGIKIKKEGRVLTDVDIIAKREDVLLIIQIKVYYGTGVNNFEQWKFRKKLEHGVDQVKKSENVVFADLHILKNHFSLEELKEIKRIKPLVVTNSHIFNGWVSQGIPIVSTSSLMQIFNGATVTFTSLDKKMKYDEKNYATSSDLSVDEFLDFLDKPLDFRIGNKDYEISNHTENFKHAVLIFPNLVKSD